MRIAAVFVGDIVNSYYRAVVPLRELERRGHSVLWPVGFTFGSTLAQLPDCDVVHIHRCMGAEDLDLVRRLRARGTAVVWDNDDHIRELPRATRRSQGLSKRKVHHLFQQTIEIASTASLMTTPSPHIAELYREAGVDSATVIENCVATADLDRARRRHTGVVIGCTAGGEHADDLKRLRIERTLERILREQPGTSVVAIGCDLKLASPRYEYRRHVPVERLIEHESHVDIGIAPIADTPFNRARSNVKLKEYATAGAMWLASPVGPYRGMGEEQGGLLVADRDWHATLTALIEDRARREELTGRAREWARRASMRHTVRTWEQAFKTAIQRARIAA